MLLYLKVWVILILWFIWLILLYLKVYNLMVYIINALVFEGLGSHYLMECFEEAKKLVDDSYKYSREEWVYCSESYINEN